MRNPYVALATTTFWLSGDTAQASAVTGKR